MQVHPESTVSFHKVTLVSPPETARIFPVMDQLTDQTTSLNLLSKVDFQEDPESCQIKTVPSFIVFYSFKILKIFLKSIHLRTTSNSTNR